MEKCPLCGCQYQKYPGPRHKTQHHIFLKRWYGTLTLTVSVCRICHNEFHLWYSTERKWTKTECVLFWKDFCKTKGKDPDKIYPILKNVT